MKKILLTLMIVFSTSSWADVISVSDADKTVYFHPKPNLEMNLQNLDSAGGILYLSLTYTTENAKNESQDLGARYPGYQITALVAAPNGAANLQIDDIISVDLPMSQQQLGPYINTSLQLTADQTKKLLNLGDNLNGHTRIRLPVSVSYRETRIIERYVTDSSICASFRAKTLKDVAVGLIHLQLPQNIRLESTLESLKEDMLNKCFAIGEADVRSFADLLKLPIAVSPSSDSLTGETRQTQTASKNLDIVPIVKAAVMR